MIKETITYTDYNGNERTEDFYFNLNKAEVMRMELSVKGGLTELIQRVVAAQDSTALMEIFEGLIQKAFGVKGADGRSFLKREADLEAFMGTEAYSILFMKLATDAEAASRFINGILPPDIAKQGDAPKHPAAN